MGIASRTKWKRRKTMKRRIRVGRGLQERYAATIRKQEKLNG